MSTISEDHDHDENMVALWRDLAIAADRVAAWLSDTNNKFWPANAITDTHRSKAGRKVRFKRQVVLIPHEARGTSRNRSPIAPAAEEVVGLGELDLLTRFHWANRYFLSIETFRPRLTKTVITMHEHGSCIKSIRPKLTETVPSRKC